MGRGKPTVNFLEWILLCWLTHFLLLLSSWREEDALQDEKKKKRGVTLENSIDLFRKLWDLHVQGYFQSADGMTFPGFRLQ